MPASKPKVVKFCAICSARIERCPSLFRDGPAYCSKACAGVSKRNGSTLRCSLCRADFYRRFGEQDRGVRVRQFCSNGCRDRFRALHRKSSVYPKRGPVHVHRILAASILGRALKRGEVVHHIDNNKHNNDPANLAVFPSQSEHMRCHQGSMTADELRKYRLAR